ncbi:MAG TPA: hypothetical protein ACFCUD_12565 [Cyclobacteriaceae bacterium]
MLSLTEKIVVHVCYRDIFNAPVLKSDLARWVGEDENSNEFLDCINALVEEQLIEFTDGYLTVNGKSNIIGLQHKKYGLTKKLIDSGKRTLMLLGKCGFVKFIGVSGSVAASNPTLNTHFSGVGHVDLDLFMITSRNSLWIFLLIERLYTNLLKTFTSKKFYCFNYVTDESFLEIYNKNFFTATELINLKLILDKKVFDSFIQKNLWYKAYYSECFNESQTTRNSTTNTIQKLMWLPNFLCFSLFVFGRALRRFDITLLRELSTNFNPEVKCNLRRLSVPRGGYQDQIKDKFESLFKENFRPYYSIHIMEYLFPKVSLFKKETNNIHDNEHSQLFKKYNEVSNAKSII